MKPSEAGNNPIARLMRPPWRTIWPATLIVLILASFYLLWSPGATITDGRHDRGLNGIWLQHGWLGDDDWFERNNKTDRIGEFRDHDSVSSLSEHLRRHHITDVFPHVAPTGQDGRIPGVHDQQTRLFISQFEGFRIMPWVGGASGVQAHPDRAEWRANFARSIRELLDQYPQLAGVHINIEPCPSGSRDFIAVLQEVRAVLEADELLSVAAYPPPTRWHPYPDVHWDEPYFREVASLSDQLVVMMYDTALTRPRFYEALMSRWTGQILDWADGTEVLLGLPAYDDTDAEYHDPEVENLHHSLAGIHAGLLRLETIPEHYRGVAVYSDWEMQPEEWAYLREHYLKPE